MTRFVTHVLPGLMLGIVLLIVGGAIAWSVFASAKPSTGPYEVVWDKAACAACGMHVGEPPFAAQATTEDGRQFAFDDPGCLFLWLAEQKPAVHSAYFRHCREDRWIAMGDAAFVAVEPTPMGFGFGAVPTGTAGAVDLDEVRRKCLERVSGHGGGR
jgi:copper chaperone NosL